MPTAWDGFDSDTREALKAVGTEARKSFYSGPSIMKSFRIIVIALSLSLIGIGFAIEKPLGFAFVLGGVLGLEVAAISLSHKSWRG
jgi:hypothetical protein